MELEFWSAFILSLLYWSSTFVTGSTMIQHAKFRIGQIIDHKLFDYRGVIFEVDPVFSLTDEWYEQVAKSRPPRDKPWYHVLVDGGVHSTYVAEQNLSESSDLVEIRHPAIDEYFVSFENGYYLPRQRSM